MSFILRLAPGCAVGVGMDILILLISFLPLRSLLCTSSSQLLGVPQGDTSHTQHHIGRGEMGSSSCCFRSCGSMQELQLGMVISGETPEGLMPHLEAAFVFLSHCYSTEWRHLVYFRTPTDTALLADHSSGSLLIPHSGVWRGIFHPDCNLVVPAI